MSIAVVTGSTGLVGSETVRRLVSLGYEVWGVDNDMRASFFGRDSSTAWVRDQLLNLTGYRHHDLDVRSDEIESLFKHGSGNIKAIVHCAAQPSHDWAANHPFVDFDVNANGTLNLLEAARHHAFDAPFVFTSTNKVYGDSPNRLPLDELETRYELASDHPFSEGIDESMSIDQTKHSLFGVSKSAADLLVQEYGRYFGMQTAVFRGGCLTGPGHSGTELHGFLSYLMKCTVARKPYVVYGYKGKQVRDNIHSVDLVNAFECFITDPRVASVYNIGGGRDSNCSMLEAIGLCERVVGRELEWSYADDARNGDHVWWISDMTRFRRDFPQWSITYDVEAILKDIFEANIDRWESVA